MPRSHSGQWDDPACGGKELCGKQTEVPSLEGVAIMEYIVGALWSGLELVCCYLFNSAFLPQKNMSRSRILQVLLIWLFACFYTNIAINQYLKLALTLTIYTILSAILLQGTFAVHALSLIHI